MRMYLRGGQVEFEREVAAQEYLPDDHWGIVKPLDIRGYDDLKNPIIVNGRVFVNYAYVLYKYYS